MDILGLIPSFGSLAFTIVAFIVALSIIIAIHEYGHYIVGRWSGIKAEVFSLGFGPVLASRVDKHGTKWQIAALPFGGYVKFLGDGGAASNPDEEVMAKLDEDQRRASMHGAPLWARAATVFAGPAFNFVLSFLIFTAFVLYYGVEREPLTLEKVLATPDEVSELLPGDILLEIGGEDASTRTALANVADTLAPKTQLDYLVERDGQEIVVQGPWPSPPVASGFSLDSAAEEAGMKPGDVVVSIDGTPIFDFEELNQATRNSEGRTLELGVWRDGALQTFRITPRKQDTQNRDGEFETRYLIGMTGGSGSLFDFQSETPGVFEAAYYGALRLGSIIENSVKGLHGVVTQKISTCAVSGPITIAKTSGQVAAKGLADFIFFVAVISAAVGFINLFPLPVLDGGHLVFHAWEALTGRPPGEKALNAMMGAGLGPGADADGLCLRERHLVPLHPVTGRSCADIAAEGKIFEENFGRATARRVVLSGFRRFIAQIQQRRQESAAATPKSRHIWKLARIPRTPYDGEIGMQTLQNGIKGLELLVEVNLDRFLIPLALGAALFLGAYIGSP